MAVYSKFLLGQCSASTSCMSAILTIKMTKTIGLFLFFSTDVYIWAAHN